MAALFPRWSDAALRLSLAALFVTALLLVIAPMIYMRTPYNTEQYFEVDQPVQFDHRHHVTDDGVDCRYCHDTVEKTAWAGVPPTSLCMGCHNQIWNQSPMIEPLRRSYFSGKPMPWNRVHQLPDFVYFDHSAHVNKGVGCVSCHGRVDQMPLVHQVAPLTMGWCLDCHRHPTPHIRPRSEITNLEWEPVGDARAEHERLARQYNVRSLTHCTTCHR